MTTPSLDQLQPLHTPDGVSWWPPAPGWWGLLLLAGATLALLAWWYRRQRRSRWRKQALAELEALAAKTGELSPAQWLSAVNVLVKRVCLTRFPRAESASLTGTAWLQFLEESTQASGFIDGPGACLGNDRYAPLADNLPTAALIELVRTWIKQVP